MSPAPPTPKPPVGKVGLSKWLSGHKWEAGLGAGGIAVTIYLAYRSRQNAANSSTSGTTSSTGSAALPASYYPPTSGGSGEGGGGGNFGNEIGELTSLLQQELAGAGAPAASSTTAPASPDASYSALSNPSDLAALTSSQTPLYYKPAGTDVYEQVGQQPGNTTNPELAWIQQNLPGGTGLYVKSGS